MDTVLVVVVPPVVVPVVVVPLVVVPPVFIPPREAHAWFAHCVHEEKAPFAGQGSLKLWPLLQVIVQFFAGEGQVDADVLVPPPPPPDAGHAEHAWA